MYRPLSGTLKIIIDSNVFIMAEDLGEEESEDHDLVGAFLRIATKLGVSIVVAAGTRDDVLRAPPDTLKRRLRQLQRYDLLDSIPQPSNLARDAGFPDPRSDNDESDLDILSALAANAADWLVTNDQKLRRRAAKAQYGDRVFTVREVIETLRQSLNQPSAIPSVKTCPAYAINIESELFLSLIEDYPDFPNWWRKVARETRDVLTLGSPMDPEGVAVLKVETDKPYGIVGRALKACTFKIANQFFGTRRGELLLNATIDYARSNKCDSVYLEILPAYSFLLDWLEEFGFSILDGATTIRHEIIVRKFLRPPSAQCASIQPLEHNVMYGPGSLLVRKPYLIPIKQTWRRRLLPENEVQLALPNQEEACGNAIRKAYLCNAPARSILPGDTLIFYESHGRSAAVAAGVAESTLISRDAEEILRFAGNRTVYSSSEVQALCAEKDVLAIRFRFDRLLSPPWSLASLKAMGLLRSHPQSIQRMREEGMKWLQTQLDA